MGDRRFGQNEDELDETGDESEYQAEDPRLVALRRIMSDVNPNDPAADAASRRGFTPEQDPPPDLSDQPAGFSSYAANPKYSAESRSGMTAEQDPLPPSLADAFSQFDETIWNEDGRLGMPQSQHAALLERGEDPWASTKLLGAREPDPAAVAEAPPEDEDGLLKRILAAMAGKPGQ